MLSLKRHGVRLALATALSCLALPAAAHAALVQGVPTNVQAGYFDDHSIGGDNHRGWSAPGSQSEPVAIAFGTTLTNTFGGPFQVCGYNRNGGWMEAYEIPGLTCPSGPGSASQDGWFRYVDANHSETDAFNRWHLMDLQRFALVPLPASLGGPPAAATAWDTDWGTCLSDGTPYMDCEADATAATLATRIDAGAVKTTQEQNPAPDAERIAIPTTALTGFPDGNYQIVAIGNPYGAYSGPRTVSCVTIQLSGVGAYRPSAVQVGPLPGTCFMPTNIPAALTGPGGRDPMAGAAPTTPPCPLIPASGHCWPDPAAPPQTTAYTAAASHVNDPGLPTITATQTVAVDQPAGVHAAPPPASGASNPPAVAAGQKVHKEVVRRLSARQSRSYARRALRKQFGKHLRGLKVSCRVRHSTAATCKISYRKANGYRYSGHVWLRYKTVKNHLRWQYRMEINKRKRHHKTHKIHRGYRTGGTF